MAPQQPAASAQPHHVAPVVPLRGVGGTSALAAAIDIDELRAPVSGPATAERPAVALPASPAEAPSPVEAPRPANQAPEPHAPRRTLADQPEAAIDAAAASVSTRQDVEPAPADSPAPAPATDDDVLRVRVTEQEVAPSRPAPSAASAPAAPVQPPTPPAPSPSPAPPTPSRREARAAEKQERRAAKAQEQDARRAAEEARKAEEKARKTAEEARKREAEEERRRTQQAERQRADEAKRAREEERRAREAAAREAREQQRETKEAAARAKQDARRAKKEQRSQKRERPAAAAEAPTAPEELARVKLSRFDRRLVRLGKTLALVEGETITLALDGRSHLSKATLIMTNYRVAVVTHRTRRARWIPLEEVATISTAWRGRPTIIVDASVEVLHFGKRSTAALEPALEALEREVRIARQPGARRHSAEIVQAWCDRTGDVWDSDANRLRLWIRRHPVFAVTWLASIVPLAYLLASRSVS